MTPEAEAQIDDRTAFVVAEAWRDCYRLYVVTNCSTRPALQEPVRDPAAKPWREVAKVAHCRL